MTIRAARAAADAAPAAKAASPRSKPAQVTLGRVDDPLEHMADRVADAVIAGRPLPASAPFPAAQAPAARAIRAKSAGDRPPAGDAQTAVAALAQPGAPLPATARRYFEPRFGRDLSGVRVHSDAATATAASAIGARAFTFGADIGFASGRFAPDSTAGRHLLAHELAHVAQGGEAIRRAPDDKATEKSPEADAPVKFAARDLLVYPLFIDLWNDIFRQKLTDRQKKEFKRKGIEGAAVWNLLTGLPLSGQAPGDDKSVGDFLSAWLQYADQIHTIAGGENIYLDLFSTFAGINLDSYLGSDLFISRLKTHAASLVTVLAVAQVTLSTLQALKEPSAKAGEFEPTQAERQLLLLTTLFNTVMKEQLKAPDFFAVGPLKLATHPAYAGVSAAGGGAAPGLIFEQREGQGAGQGGEVLKLGLTLNLPQIVGLFQKDAPPSKDVADLKKYHGWQGSLWFNYDRTIPTLLQRDAGKLPAKAFQTGTIFGGGGYLGLLEGGARYGGEAADELSAWFVRGGFGYSGKKGANLQRIGFTATFTDWTTQDVLAPPKRPGEAPAGGSAAQFTPFAAIEFGQRHKFGAGAALSFVTGSHESLGLSDFRGNLSYTYLGNTAEGELPAFKLDLTGSVSRLDWWSPDSPLLTGIKAQVSVRRFFAAGQINTGADAIPAARAAQIERPDKLPAPTSALFTAGYNF
ncbi:MAG: hypothetical protein JWM38_2340 [Sphingomonas bacterium]|nr:hypothetical protein [Sphingomonas bacterium]